MQGALWSTTAPVTPRWSDPGDAAKSAARKRRQTAATSPTRSNNSNGGTRATKHAYKPKEKYKPNPFRQPIADPDESEFRHMHWQRTRDKVLHTMQHCHQSPHAIDRFVNCGAECMVEWSDKAGRYRVKASFCKCRHCRPCANNRGNLIRINLQKKLEAGTAQECDRFRFITLTKRHSTRPLNDQIADLYRDFKILRRSKLWTRTQRGGAVLFEITIGEDGNWHPHLHIVSEGDFIRQDKLANEWMRLTGGSFKVDVRAINSAKDVAAYVCKYVSKGVPDAIWNNPSKAQEWLTASKGLRSCATFGKWRGFKLLAKDPANDHDDWKPVGLLSRFCADARAGHVYALEMLRVLADCLQYDPTRVRAPRPKPSS